MLARLAYRVSSVGLAVAVAAASSSWLHDPDGMATGASLQRGDGSPGTIAPGIVEGAVAYSFGDALTNADDVPITVLAVRPERVDPGLVFDGAYNQMDVESAGYAIGWVGTPEEEKDYLAHRQLEPVAGTVIPPGGVLSRLQLRYHATRTPRGPLRATDLHVTYRRGGEVFAEVLHQRVAFTHAPPADGEDPLDP